MQREESVLKKLKPFKEGEDTPPLSLEKMETIKQEGKTGITHNGENVPACVTLVNEKLEMAIKKVVYKYMIPRKK